jgi:hypothetical protein
MLARAHTFTVWVRSLVLGLLEPDLGLSGGLRARIRATATLDLPQERHHGRREGGRRSKNLRS